MNTQSPSPLPAYLTRHAPRGFDDDDVTALLDAIESSQVAQSRMPLQLPAELLLLILEFVPIDYILQWRGVCRAFRKAIDGRILYAHLQRTELIGVLGTQDAYPMDGLSDEQFDEIHQLRAHFVHIESASTPTQPKPIWLGTHAVFSIDEAWYKAFRLIGGAEARRGDTVEDADTRWLNILDKLELRRPEEGYGSLRWCVKLDHAVLDLDFPLEAGRNAFDVDVHLHKRYIRIAWKDMLVRFLKTEMQLRRTMEQKRTSPFTFSHAEDCIRAIRRARLRLSLNPDNKVDRHIQWSLRLLRPLFGKPRTDHMLALVNVEDTATSILLLLRRKAGMTDEQIAYLERLQEDHRIMESEIQELEAEFKEFKAHMSAPSIEFALPSLVPSDFRLARNPISWADETRLAVEERVGKWRNQKKVIKQIHVLLSASNEALQVPDDSFDNLDSDV